jgi:hypothetical protein
MEGNMAIQLQIGLDVIHSYKRLAYTPWHALAEFVDNSTQSYFDHKDELDALYSKEGEGLTVSITYDREQSNGFLRIADNATGMSEDELSRALHVALPPLNTSGRSKYGMGLKTAACWIGNTWTIRTKKYGQTDEYMVTVEVDSIASGNSNLPTTVITDRPKEAHYTVIEITEHNRKFQGRTISKIQNYLASMYREDFRAKILTLEWQGAKITWNGFEDRLLYAPDGSKYKKEFEYYVDGKKVWGWVGIFDKGGRPDAGFSIIHCGRVIKGWPESWRPTSLYGQIQGSNDLVNQRLFGEIHLDDFEVSHTKDDILWLGIQEEEVGDKLFEYCADYRDIALKRRKGGEDERGPSEIEVTVAVDELKKELTSPEMVDSIKIELVPPEAVVAESVKKIADSVASTREATFHAKIYDLEILIFIAADMSPNDPYVTVDATMPSCIIVVINTQHPHWGQLKGSEGVLNYLRHCTYDAIAEWQARSKAARIDPSTIKLLKDKLLRVPFELEEHASSVV